MINTTRTLSDEMQIFYEKSLIDNAEPCLVYESFADKYPIPKGNGKTILFRKYSRLAKAKNPIEEGVTPKGNAINVSSISASVEQYGDYVRISDVLQTTAVDNNILQISKLLGAQAGRTLDSITRDVICAGTNVFYANNKNGQVLLREELDEESKLSVDIFYRVAAKLKSMNAETIDGSYIAIIHPYTAYDLMKSKDWIDVHKYSSTENIFNGEVGKIANIRFVVSSEAKVIKSKDLCDTRTLTVQKLDNNIVHVDETIETKYIESLKGRKVSIGEEVYSIEEAGDKYIKLDRNVKAIKGDIVYPSETGKRGLACFLTMVIAAHAYASTSIDDGGLKHIVKQNGYGEDPLNQRASIGWKATKAVKRLVEEYMIRIESTSEFSDEVEEN